MKDQVAEKNNADLRNSTIQLKARVTDENRGRDEAEEKLRQQSERLHGTIASLEKDLADTKTSLAVQEALVSTKDKDLSAANLSNSKTR